MASAMVVGMPDEKPLSILLVEDDPDAALLFRRAFTKTCSGWHLEHAENGLFAIDWILARGLPTAVITDLQMPGMTGYELIAWIRAERREVAAPIYVMSGSLDATVVDYCRDLGASEFIPKQCCPNELRAILRRLFPDNPVSDLVKAGSDGQGTDLPGQFQQA